MRRKREERRKIRRLKIRTLCMLSFTLIFNTYAWFLYVTTVSTNMTVYVDAWSVNFEVGDQVIEKELLFEIEQTYPGMEEILRTVTINNSGEKAASLSHKIVMLRVLDKTYVVENELTTEEKELLTGAETKISSEEMSRMIEEDFPFKITVETSVETLEVNETASISMKFNWDYETGNDELDTQYGVDSYNYYQNNAGESAIEAKIKLKAEQTKE